MQKRRLRCWQHDSNLWKMIWVSKRTWLFDRWVCRSSADADGSVSFLYWAWVSVFQSIGDVRLLSQYIQLSVSVYKTNLCCLENPQLQRCDLSLISETCEHVGFEWCVYSLSHLTLTAHFEFFICKMIFSVFLTDWSVGKQNIPVNRLYVPHDDWDLCFNQSNIVCLLSNI